MNFRFRDQELEGIVWIDHSLEALLFDAIHGSNASRKLVFLYFSNCVNNKKKIPIQILQYVSEQLDALLSGKIKPQNFLNPFPSNTSNNFGNMMSDMVTWMSGGEGSVYEKVGSMFYKSDKSIQTNVYKARRRSKRLSTISKMLSNWRHERGSPGSPEHHAWREECSKAFEETMNDYYSDPSKLDK